MTNPTTAYTDPKMIAAQQAEWSEHYQAGIYARPEASEVAAIVAAAPYFINAPSVPVTVIDRETIEITGRNWVASVRTHDDGQVDITIPGAHAIVAAAAKTWIMRSLQCIAYA